MQQITLKITWFPISNIEAKEALLYREGELSVRDRGVQQLVREGWREEWSILAHADIEDTITGLLKRWQKESTSTSINAAALIFPSGLYFNLIWNWDLWRFLLIKAARILSRLIYYYPCKLICPYPYHCIADKKDDTPVKRRHKHALCEDCGALKGKSRCMDILELWLNTCLCIPQGCVKLQ